MPQVDKCCCCVDLRTGSLIIGFLNLLWNILLTVLAAPFLTAVIAYDAKNQNVQDIATIATIAMLAIVLVLAVMNILFNILLFVGIYKTKRGLVKAYLIYTSIVSVLHVFFGIVMSIAQLIGAIVLIFVSLMFSVYFLIVIRSYFLKMNSPSMMQA